jgi:hypothetical protein
MLKYNLIVRQTFALFSLFIQQLFGQIKLGIVSYHIPNQRSHDFFLLRVAFRHEKRKGY